MTHLPPFTLPLPDGALPLHLDLALVEAMEESAGGLYALAAELLAGTAPHAALLRLLRTAYRHAGCTLDAVPLEDYLMTLPAARLVTALLAAVLTPLSRIDIAQEAVRMDAAQTVLREDRPQENVLAGEYPPAKAGI